MSTKTHEAPMRWPILCEALLMGHLKNFQFKKDFVGVVAVFD